MSKIFKSFSGILLVTLLGACAKIGTPPGGPKDETAPVVISSKPGNYSTNYERRNILIKFDEFVTLKDVYTEFTVSPPLEKTPMPYTRGKGVMVELPSAELDSFTYTLDFGQSIADNNEGNPLPNFQFVVTKQAHIDSFSVSGKLVDAFTHKPDKEGLYVYLNRNLSDTVPYTTVPSYLGKTGPKGKFKINHIAPGTYSIFVLKDANANMIYDMPSEIIAFANEPVHLNPDSFLVEIDTLSGMVISDSVLMDSSIVTLTDSISEPLAVSFSTTGDSLHIESSDSTNLTDHLTDSTQTDSIEFMVYGYAVDLYSFTEKEPYNQYLVEYKRKSPEKFEVIFNAQTDSLPEIKLLSPTTTGAWYLLEKNSRNDTLTYWLPDSNLILDDSIVVALFYEETDTTGNLIPTSDTLLLRSKIKKKEPAEVSTRKREGGIKLPFGKKDEVVDTIPEKIPRVTFTNNINRNAHDLYRPIELFPTVPVFDYNPELIELYRLEDTIEHPANFTFEYDSSWVRKSIIKADFEPYTDYVLKLHEGVLTDIYGRTIDSTRIRFTTQRDDHYGTVVVDMKIVTSPIILQLLDKDRNVIQYKLLSTNKKITFDYLDPDTYFLKIIFDDNENGEWDTGDYKSFLQPERVEFFPKKLDVRSNWTVDYEWNINDPSHTEVEFDKEE